MNYVTLSIKTANQWPDSICSIELVKVENHRIVDSLTTYIQTSHTFDPFYTRIHGIEASDLLYAPTFEAFIPILEQWLQNQTVISFFAPYDHLCLQESFEFVGRLMPLFTHRSILNDVKEQWPSLPSYTLYDVYTKVASTDALHDAERMVHVFEALQKMKPLPMVNMTVEKSLFQKTIVFTGALEHMRRSDAARKVMQAGGYFTNTLTKKVDILVVSERSRLQYEATQKQSSKWTKALYLQQQGFPIHILSEQEFLTWF